MDIVEGGIAAAAAAFSGWAAWSAMKAAKSADRNGQVANRTAELAYQTAEAVAQIERDRWHKELTPAVFFWVTKERGFLELVVRYDGPSSLGKLDSLELLIRDDRDRSNDQVLAGSLTVEERDRTIWGPYRFTTTAYGDDIGRTTDPLSLPPGEEYRLALNSTHPHQHYGAGYDAWRAEYGVKDFRLWATCTVAGHKPWTLTADIPHRQGETGRATSEGTVQAV
ncbi:hypothetical protein [Streptomyces sp. NBC_01353]|uniref:hypothetical protein n=1 Tax=Streptomyces sp. NBC_01353 TaxID=2903835 RepID=UPI002E36EF71|nr:hypothetical protein [Streptomyces sp. NBC_01353]